MWLEIMQQGLSFGYHAEILFYNITNFDSNPWGAEKWPYRNSSFTKYHILLKIPIKREIDGEKQN